MYSDDDPQPRPGLGATLGGCFLALLLGVYLLFADIFVWAWTGRHCAPGAACRHFGTGWLALRMAVALVPIGLLALSLRGLFHWFGRRNVVGVREAGPMPGRIIWGLTAAFCATILFLSWPA